jgi:transketolase
MSDSDRHLIPDAFAKALLDLAVEDERVVALANDSLGSSKLGNMKTRFPERVFNVGIAEQDLVGIAAGLAGGGKKPFACGASCFLTGRALEQIKVDIAYSEADVTLCGMSAGVAYGPLGPTHHSIEDLAWLRAIAGLTVVVPADGVEAAHAVRAAVAHPGPVYLRMARVPVRRVHPPDHVFQFGRAGCLRDGGDVTLIANGVMVERALEAAEELAGRGVEARVLNMATVSPLDREAVESAARETGAIVTVEEHQVHGGLGSAVAEVVVATHPVPVRILGVPGVFAPTGSPDFILEHFDLTPGGIRDAALELVEARAGAGRVAR